MSKALGNISYNEIVKNRDKVIRREGVDRDTFENLMKKMNICGFENEDGSITVYFNGEDTKVFDSASNKMDTGFTLNKIIERLDNLDSRLSQLHDIILKSQSEKGLEEDIKSFDDKLDSTVEYISEYCSIINEIKSSIGVNRSSDNSCNGKAVVEANGWDSKMDELMDRFDSLYGDMVRNMAYLRSDLKIKIGQKSVSKKGKAFFIYLSGFLSAAAVLIIFRNFILRWFL